jgi:hypothetical protein
VDASNQKPGLKVQLLERLHNPFQLRVALTGLAVVIGYGAVYLPLNGDLEETVRRLTAEHKRRELALDIESLRTRFATFKRRLSDKPDSNEWMEYVLCGIRQFPLKLTMLDPDAPREVGPYKALVVRIELEGPFPDQYALLRWFESNERIFRVDAVKIAPHRKIEGMRVMQLTILGLMG